MHFPVPRKGVIKPNLLAEKPEEGGPTMKNRRFMTPEEAGAKLVRMHDYRAMKYVDQLAEQMHTDMQGQLAANQEEINQLEEKKRAIENDLQIEKRKSGHISEERARNEHRRARWRYYLSIPLGALSGILIYDSLAPSFYGHEYFALAVAIGAAILLIVGAELLLDCLGRSLTHRQMNIFIILTTLLMFTSALGGAIFFHKSRALQRELQQQSEESLIGKTSEDFLDADKIKQQIDKYNMHGMVLLFLGLEWLAGVFLWRSVKSKRRYEPMVSLMGKLDTTSAAIGEHKKENARFGDMTKEKISKGLTMGIQNGQKKGNLTLMIASIAIILGMILFFLLFAQNAFGESPNPRYFLVALDRTGSTEHDRLENERAVLSIIDSLKPSDAIQIMLVTEATFSNPEYVISGQMPSRAGYFNEELRRSKLHLMNEFRGMAEKLSNERPATSLLDGIWMFARMCRENRDREKVMVLLSDMRQFGKGIDENMITKDPDLTFSLVKSKGLIPDMKGVTVYVMGVSTAGMTVEKWRNLEMFWRKFFANGGAKLMSYDMGRHWPQD
jgi:hypothetical protein